ncbi:FMNH2-dependent monooxygenase [Rhodococcus sp. 14-2686-1-2]|nr:FMNH2-dependent monooxygenase [Rhodococcus sp. 15-1189-1-1a]OZF21153.1 FMNH2-dependent monooxygenase [Rhodococcus sp. 14-2686-1-2]
MSTPFTLGWFTNYLVPDWTGPWAGTGGTDWADGSFAVDIVRKFERAGIDFVMLEDSTALTDIYGGTFESELKWTPRAPKHDPMALASRLAYETEKIGIVVTASTSFYPPFLLTRLLSTLDHLSHGRIGWNIVTSTGDRAAQNFGHDTLPVHDERYEIAEEFVDVANALWASWDVDAASPIHPGLESYVDHTKVRTIDHAGKHFKVRGPLNTLPSPQGKPVICQAGASASGIDLAARVADLVVSAPKGRAAMRAYRDTIRSRAAGFGRNPDDVKVLYMVTPILGETEKDARRRAERYYEPTDAAIARRLIMLSGDIDFSRFDVDKPIPDDLHTEGSTSILENLRTWAAGRTIRETVAAERTESLRLVGTPASVADEMESVIEEVGGDGFLFFGGGGGVLNRRYVDDVCDGLMPELRRRGVAGTGFRGQSLREHLAGAR